MYFCYFVINSPWKKAGPFIWNKLSPHAPRMHCTKFCWIWPSGSGEEIFLYFVNVYSIFANYLPLEKGGSSCEQTWIHSTKGCFVPSLIEVGPVIVEKKMKMWKLYRQTDGQTDRRIDRRRAKWSENLSWAFRSDELKNKTISEKPKYCHTPGIVVRCKLDGDVVYA